MSERDAIVAWLRAEADRMEGDMRADPEGEMAVMYGQRMLYYRQAASSIERGDHLPASVAGACAGCEGLPSIDNNPCAVCGQAHRATHAAEVERMREALETIRKEAERENGGWVHLKRAIAIAARQALEASR